MKIPDSILQKFKNETWRLEKLYKIRTKQGKIQSFKLNNVQKILDSSLHKRNMTLKARQKGVTTYYGLKYLNRACFRKNYTAALISHDQESIERIFRPIRLAYDKMPSEFQPEVDKGGGSKYHLYFPKQNSRIYVALEVRSEAINDLHVSEYGLMKNKDRFNSSIDAVPISGDTSVESTPKGMNHFYYDWRDPDFPFKKHLFPWYIDEEYSIPLNGEIIIPTEEEVDLIEKAAREFKINLTMEQLKWRRDKIKIKGQASFMEEFLEDDISCFLTSGDSVLDLFYVKSLLDNYIPHAREIDGIRIFIEPCSKETYVIGADAAGGTGGDANTAVVYRVRDFAQCAHFQSNKIRPNEFANKLAEIGEIYTVRGRAPLLGVERNNHGHAVILALTEILRYPNLFTHDDHDQEIGWITTTLTRHILIDTFVEAFESRTLKPRDKEFLKECLALINNNGKIEATDGEHDDAIMATAIAIQLILKEKPNEIYYNANENFLI